MGTVGGVPPAKRLEVEIGDRRLSLSNLDKVLYPEVGFTKGQVIDYYTRIAPAVLPHLRDRPLTLKRYPNGVHQQYFYEKQSPSHRPDWVQTAAVFSRSNSRTIDFTICNDLPTLVWLANLADLELHTSLALYHDVKALKRGTSATEWKGELFGATINSLTSVSLEPCMLLVCTSEGSATGTAIRKRELFSVNILGQHQSDLSARFTGNQKSRFEDLAVAFSADGLPLLQGAAAQMCCRVSAVHKAGDHDIILGEVLSGEDDSAGAAGPGPFRFAGQAVRDAHGSRTVPAHRVRSDVRAGRTAPPRRRPPDPRAPPDPRRPAHRGRRRERIPGPQRARGGTRCAGAQAGGCARVHRARAVRADEPTGGLPQRPLRARGDLLRAAHRRASVPGAGRAGVDPLPHRARASIPRGGRADDPFRRRRDRR